MIKEKHSQGECSSFVEARHEEKFPIEKARKHDEKKKNIWCFCCETFFSLIHSSVESKARLGKKIELKIYKVETLLNWGGDEGERNIESSRFSFEVKIMPHLMIVVFRCGF